MATHSLVTMPVVSQSQKRKKWEGIGPSSIARCACARCKKMVTEAMVMCVITKAAISTCHQVRRSKPSAKKSIAALRTAQSGSSIGETMKSKVQ